LDWIISDFIEATNVNGTDDRCNEMNTFCAVGAEGQIGRSTRQDQ